MDILFKLYFSFSLWNIFDCLVYLLLFCRSVVFTVRVFDKIGWQAHDKIKNYILDFNFLINLYCLFLVFFVHMLIFKMIGIIRKKTVVPKYITQLPLHKKWSFPNVENFIFCAVFLFKASLIVMSSFQGLNGSQRNVVNTIIRYRHNIVFLAPTWCKSSFLKDFS